MSDMGTEISSTMVQPKDNWGRQLAEPWNRGTKKRSLWRLYYCINPGKMVWILLDTSAWFIPHSKISGKHPTRVCNKTFTCIYSLPHLFYYNKQSYRGDSPTGVWYELLWHRSRLGSLFKFFSLLLPSPPRLTGEKRGVV